MDARHILPLAVGTVLLALALLTLTPRPAEALKCSTRYPEVCSTCDQVADIYRNFGMDRAVQRGRAVWTPVYTAFFHDCSAVADAFLRAGASPVLGGAEGDLLGTVVIWPRFTRETRIAWARRLIDHGARLDHRGLDGLETGERLRRAAETDQDVAEILRVIEFWLAGG